MSGLSGALVQLLCILLFDLLFDWLHGEGSFTYNIDFRPCVLDHLNTIRTCANAESD